MADFSSRLNEALKTIKEQDGGRKLGTMEKTPTSLMDYPKFGGHDSLCYFK